MQGAFPLNIGRGNRRIDHDLFERQIPGQLIGHEPADLADETAKAVRGRAARSNQGQLVLDQRMVDHIHWNCHRPIPRW